MKTYNNRIENLKDVKRLLFVVDVVNGFMKEGTLANDSYMRIVPRIEELCKYYLEEEDTGLVFIRDYHTKDAVEFKRFPAHCIGGTKESEVIDELKIYEENAIEFLKNSTNLIFAAGMQRSLNYLNKVNEIELCGVLSNVCVENGAIGLKTFLEQNNRLVDVSVHADAIDTFDSDELREETTDFALKNMEANGIKILGKRLERIGDKNENL